MTEIILQRDRNHVPIQGSSYVSTENSSTTALNAGDTFTGEWVSTLGFSSIKVSVKTDQNGHYIVQYSPDGTNIDSTLTRYYRTNQIEPPHKFENMRLYVRVLFVNSSASNQTYLRLETILSNSGAVLNIPIDSTMSQDYDSTSVRPTNFNYEVALGRRQGNTTWNKFGYNADIDIGTEVVAAFGGTFTPLTSASTLTIVSSSAADDGSPAGTGANTIIIYGVDANYVSQTETVTLNGTTNVVTSTTWLGINRAAVSLSGSGLTNAGLITITATTGGSTQATIPIGEGTSQQAIFFTQLNHQSLADTLKLNAEKTGGGASPKIIFKGWLFNSVTNTKTLIYRQLVDTAVENSFTFIPSQPFVLPEKSCLWFEGTTDTNDTFVSCRFSLIEVRDIDA